MPESNGLRAAIDALIAEYGFNRDEWTVLSDGADPFRLDTPANHRDAAWLADTMARLNITREIHNRGIHYATLTQPKPDGTPYGSRPIKDGVDPDWVWLQKVSVAARWLGYVDWEQITDERNAEPVFRLWTPPQPEGYAATDFRFYLPNEDDLTPKATLDDFRGKQRYHLAIIGEKASLRDVLEPIAEEYQADLYLMTGNISNTRIHDLAANAVEDGRFLVTFYFSDCDPSGWHMPIEVGRKLAALKMVRYPQLRFRCQRVGLTIKQVKAFKAAGEGLPESPVKETDKRAAKWERETGLGQTEIDSLATLQPDLLAEIAIDAIKPFFDSTLDERAAAAQQDWERRAQAAVEEQTTQEQRQALTDALAALDRKRDEIEEILDTIAVDEDEDDLDLPALPQIPTAEIDQQALPKPLVSSQWDFVVQTFSLTQSRDYKEIE